MSTPAPCASKIALERGRADRSRRAPTSPSSPKSKLIELHSCDTPVARLAAAILSRHVACMSRPPPKLQTSTLWYHPSQQHGRDAYGDPRFKGATPTYVIWNLLERYTREGDLVVDPFCGGGTTLDVAREMKRRALGYDVAPTRRISCADARDAVEDGKADFVFADPPY